MNLPVIFSNIGRAAKGLAGTTVVAAKKHAPEMLVATGIGGFILTIVETVKATNSTNEILERKEARVESIENCKGQDGYSEQDYTFDMKAVGRQTRTDLIKVWAPVATTTIVSAVCVLSGFNILNGRYVATAAAYKTLEAGYQRYRENVISEFGRDTDWRMAHSIKAEELEAERRKQEEIRENGKRNKKRIPKTQYSRDINNQIFDCHSSDRWKKYWIPSQVMDFIHTVESQLQDKVNSGQGVFLNDAYDMLGMPRTAQGAMVGWINTPRNKHNERGQWVSLGFANDETPEDEIRRILSSPSNEETWLWITPNCDGVIYQLLDKPFSER